MKGETLIYTGASHSVKLTTIGYGIYAPLPYALAKYVNHYDQKGKWHFWHCLSTISANTRALFKTALPAFKTGTFWGSNVHSFIHTAGTQGF